MSLFRWPPSLAKLQWKLRPYFLRHPLPHEIEKWRLNDFDFEDVHRLDHREREIDSWWLFLKPFFSASGYEYYVAGVSRSDILYPFPIEGKPTSRQTHPFGRRLYSNNKDASFNFETCIRPARDKFGRDVVIRLVSGRKPSAELLVLRRLTSPSALQDPRNITIPILDWLEFDGFVFIAMPRWGPAWLHDFGTVAEHIHLAGILLAYLDFLHEQRIVHLDIHAGNMAINTIVPDRLYQLKGLRNPSVTRYAVFDFGMSLIYPYETPLDEVQEDLAHYNWEWHDLPVETAPTNPFALDVGSLGAVFKFHVQVIRDVVPEIIPFIQSMTAVKPSDRPTAHEAYRHFESLKSRLTTEQLNSPVADLSYKGNGKYEKKRIYKNHPQLPDPDWCP